MTLMGVEAEIAMDLLYHVKKGRGQDNWFT